MAAFDIDFPVDFMSELLDTDFEEIAKAALEETAPILENSMKQSCRRVIEHPGESELVDSIKRQTHGLSMYLQEDTARQRYTEQAKRKGNILYPMR